MIKRIAAKVRDVISELHFQFICGMQFMSLINFALLIVTASDKLQSIFNIPSATLIAIAIPLGFAGIWLLGFVLDVLLKYSTKQMETSEKRSPAFRQLNNKLDELIRRLPSPKEDAIDQRDEK